MKYTTRDYAILRDGLPWTTAVSPLMASELAAELNALHEALRVAVAAVAKSERLMEIQAQRDSDEAEHAASGETYSYTAMAQAWNEADIAIVACKLNPLITQARKELAQ